ncbi:cation acetate symporter [Kitasatospora sp. NPDC089509]|uniref:sodium/solute symporter n=1 Tax=Kitasatospora sp. NPDC089509 TaxID=3364079 RepID=UPI003819A94E
MSGSYAIAAVALVALATVLIGGLGLRLSRTTSDFYVASRAVNPRVNGAAISGEYLSAASFLGIAGLVLTDGAHGLWYPVGYTAGYLVLLFFVAAPLRRSGAYTVPDFAEARLESARVRRTASLLVIVIGWLYLMPQLYGAGLTLRTATGAPEWLGGVLVAVVVTANVLAGGMRSVTLVQAFQYWLKLTALLVPLVFLLLAWRADGAPRAFDAGRPVFHRAAAVRVDQAVRIEVTEGVRVTVRGTVDGRALDHEEFRLTVGRHTVGPRTVLDFPAGAAVPLRADGPPVADWGRPAATGSEPHPLYATYGLILATFLGAMGLPHVVVRFYTSPDGRAARRTTLVVLGLLGVFYLLPPVYGALARLYAPDLALTGNTDAAVLLLPERLIGGTGGALLGALLAGGAFAAFVATSSGLAVSLAGVLHQDFLRSPGVRGFRRAAALAMAAPAVLTLVAPHLSIADAVGLAFAVAASSLCPLLVLGIWWPRLTPAGAVVGALAGGGAALVATALTMTGRFPDGWPHTLLAWPAVWTVPLGFLGMVAVSLATPGTVPPGTAATLARLHLPEPLTAEAPNPEQADPGPSKGRETER